MKRGEEKTTRIVEDKKETKRVDEESRGKVTKRIYKQGKKGKGGQKIWRNRVRKGDSRQK